MTDTNDAFEILTDLNVNDLSPEDRAAYDAQCLRLDVLAPIMGIVGEPTPTGITAATLAATTGRPLADIEATITSLIDDERIVTRDADGSLHYRQTPWSEMYPDGREVFYEGDDPAGFVATVRDRFGFDPAADPRWNVTIPGDATVPAFQSYAFHCPVQHLDALYGTGEYPLGS